MASKAERAELLAAERRRRHDERREREASAVGLAEWLAAQVDEDERRAKAATEGPWAWEATGEKDGSWAVGHVQDEDGRDLTGQLEHGQGVVIDGVCEGIDGNLGDAEHIARHDPGRVLREVAFKRTLVISELPPWVALEMARIYGDRPGYAEATGDHRER